MAKLRRPWTGLMVPARRAIQVPVRIIHPVEHCDRCGHSRVDGAAISLARFVVRTPRGPVYLCGHHFRRHRHHIHERAYEVDDA